MDEKKWAEKIFNELKKNNSITAQLLLQFYNKLINLDVSTNNNELELREKMIPYINQLNEMNNPSHVNTDIKKEEKDSLPYSMLQSSFGNPINTNSFQLQNFQNNSEEIMKDIDDCLVKNCFEKIKYKNFNITLFMEKMIELYKKQ